MKPKSDMERLMEARIQEQRGREIKARRKRERWLSVGKWVADNIVAIGALAVAIIALVRTF